jgi:hypothetical protein
MRHGPQTVGFSTDWFGKPKSAENYRLSDVSESVSNTKVQSIRNLDSDVIAV